VSASVALIVVTFIICTISIYLVVYRPLLSDRISLEMHRASDKVASDVQTIFLRVETIAARNREWGSTGLITLDNLQDLNRLIGPVFKNVAAITSAAIAQDSGREILIYSGTETGWLNRITDPDAWGNTARILAWNARGDLVSSEQREVDYDARQRPWYKGVMAQAADDAIYWTPPYKFFSTQELGISAVVRWMGVDGHAYAMTTDIKLLDLTKFTQQITVGKSGLAAVLTAEGMVLAVPRDPRFATTDAVKAALLKRVDEIAISPLTAAFMSWQAAGRPEDRISTFEVSGTAWLTTFNAIHLADQTFWVATLAPSADFGTLTGNTALLGIFIVLGAAAIASLAALWLGRRFSAPIEQLTRESARIGQMDLRSPIAVKAPVREIDVLAQSLEKMRVNLDRSRTELETSAALERQAQAALRHNEARYRALVENSSDSISIYRPDGTMLYRSPSVGALMLGYDEAAVLGKNVFERAHPDDAPNLVATFAWLAEVPGRQKAGRVRMRDSDGTWHHIAWSARNAINVPGIDGIIANAHDITELVTLADQLQQAQKLEALGQLAGGIAHDFNNVLGAMLGFAGFLVEDLPPDSREHHYAQSIVKAGQNATDLVSQILTFARRGSVERKPFDLAQILREVRDLLRGTLPTSTELAIDIEPGTMVADVNLAQMNQLLFNLCVNANDALAGEPGRISLSLARLQANDVDFDLACGEQNELATLKPGGYLVLRSLDPSQSYGRVTVADNGPGMEESVLARVFEPFFTTKERGRGTGLGLAVVRSIVSAYGGACIVASRPGAGTRFGIYIPLKDVAVTSAVAEDVEPRRGHGERIMVVDDDEALAEMLASGLERLGYEVVSLTDPREALEAFSEDPDYWNVVVSDQTMPGMKGTTLYQQLRAIRPSVRFILCTGYDDGASTELASESGIVARFLKPVSPQQISATIAQLMGEPRRAANA
jgi:PAS domain S-box-containing protein